MPGGRATTNLSPTTTGAHRARAPTKEGRGTSREQHDSTSARPAAPNEPRPRGGCRGDAEDDTHARALLGVEGPTPGGRHSSRGRNSSRRGMDRPELWETVPGRPVRSGTQGDPGPMIPESRGPGAPECGPGQDGPWDSRPGRAPRLTKEPSPVAVAGRLRIRGGSRRGRRGRGPHGAGGLSPRMDDRTLPGPAATQRRTSRATARTAGCDGLGCLA